MEGLKSKRVERGLKQSWVANKLGVKANTLSQWENGIREPNLTMLKKLAKFFECTIEELL